MNFLHYISLLIPLFCVCVKSESLSCEKITDGVGDWRFSGFTEALKTCWMKTTSTIGSEGFVISPTDPSVLAISFYYNKKISFLPINMGETFPNLVAYGAASCSLKTLSKINFKNLKKLKQLHLQDNQIERIKIDTFEDLELLEKLYLQRNKLKQMNGEVFTGLNALKDVSLFNNICIDRHYKEGQTAIANLHKEISASCSYDENSVEIIFSDQRILIESLRGQLMKEKELLVENVKLKTKLEAAEEVKLQLKDQIQMQTTLHSKLEKQWNSTCDERTKECEEIVQKKLEEVSGLSEKQKKIRADLTQREMEVIRLEKKVEDLNCN